MASRLGPPVGPIYGHGAVGVVGGAVADPRQSLAIHRASAAYASRRSKHSIPLARRRRNEHDLAILLPCLPPPGRGLVAGRLVDHATLLSIRCGLHRPTSRPRRHSVSRGSTDERPRHLRYGQDGHPAADLHVLSVACALRRAPWRCFSAVRALSLLAYALRLIDRARLKEVNQHFLIGHEGASAGAEAAVEASPTVRSRRTFARVHAKRSRATRPKDAGWSRDRLIPPLRRGDCRAARLRRRHRDGLDHRPRRARPRPDRRRQLLWPAKMRMIADWVENSGLRVHGHVRFYSDHVSDQPAFEWADEPVGVNPHGKLRRLAEERGWALEDWG